MVDEFLLKDKLCQKVKEAVVAAPGEERVKEFVSTDLQFLADGRKYRAKIKIEEVEQ